MIGKPRQDQMQLACIISSLCTVDIQDILGIINLWSCEQFIKITREFCAVAIQRIPQTSPNLLSERSQ